MNGRYWVEAITIAIHGGLGFHSSCSYCGKWQKTAHWSSECETLRHDDLIAVLQHKKTLSHVVFDEVTELGDRIAKLESALKSMRQRERKVITEYWCPKCHKKLTDDSCVSCGITYLLPKRRKES